MDTIPWILKLEFGFIRSLLDNKNISTVYATVLSNNAWLKQANGVGEGHIQLCQHVMKV
jgi:hypothetical protein